MLMPSLPAALRDSADKVEPSTFEAYDPGVYTARLAKVEAVQAKGSGNPMWAMEFDQVKDLKGNKKPGKLFTNLVLIDSVNWKIAQFFAAFGVPTNTNTDELLNHRIRLEVGRVVAEQGKRKGQEINEVGNFVAAKEDDEGYEALVKIQRANAKPTKATATKAAPKAAAKPAEDVPDAEDQAVDAAVEESGDDDIDF